MNTSPSSVDLPPAAILDDFRRVLKAENPNQLSSVDPGQFQVYANAVSVVENRPLEVLTHIRDLESSPENPLRIVVPTLPPVSQDFSSAEKKRRVQELKKALFFTYFNDQGRAIRACVTAFEKRRLATFAHGLHKDLKVNDTVTVHSIVRGSAHKVKVFRVDQVHDYILLEDMPHRFQRLSFL